MNIARLITEADKFSIDYGMGDHDLDLSEPDGAMVSMEFTRLVDGSINAHPAIVKNPIAIEAIDGLTDLWHDTVGTEDDVCEWLLWIIKHFAWVGYGQIKS